MRSGLRLAMGAVSGVLWGAGSAVLLQQFGRVALDPMLLLGASVAASLVSGLWALRGERRRSAFLAPVLLVVAGFSSFSTHPSSMVLLEGFPGDGCPSVEWVTQPLISGAECVVSDSKTLADTSLFSPFRIGDTDGWIVLQVGQALFSSEGGEWELWIEYAGVKADFPGGRYARGVDSLRMAIDLSGDNPDFYMGAEGEVLFDGLNAVDVALVTPEDDWWAFLTNLTGVYHLGGSVNGNDFDGYINFGGNPFTLDNPIGWVGLGLAVLGLAGAWLAGRPGTSRRRRRRGERDAERLQPDGQPKLVAGITVSSPGLDGEVEVRRPDAGETFGSSTGWDPSLVDAFAEHHAQVQLTVEIAKARELTDMTAKDMPTTRHGEPAVVLEVPGPDKGWGQFVVATDESGVAGWSHPMPGAGAAGGVNRYAIPRRVGPVARRKEGEPHLFGELGSKLLNVIVFPLLDPVFGAVGERFAQAWEAKKRPYRLRTFTPENYSQSEADEPDWDHVASGKALVVVHGTFSQTHTGFAGMSPELVGDIAELYEGRVFGFDHHTLSDDPRHNIEWFFDHLPGGIELDLDVLCHSRGGLVSRVLAEKQTEINTDGRTVRVNKIVFAAAPNAGTVLADAEHLGDLLDSYANLMNFAVVPLVADAVITVVKHAAVGALRGLDGLQAMSPQGEFLKWLNSATSDTGLYFAMSGDFEPDNQGWKKYAADRLMDRIFQEPNDLVVPTAGVYAENGSNRFPITNRLEFGESDGVHHSGYFGHPSARDQLLAWLRQ